MKIVSSAQFEPDFSLKFLSPLEPPPFGRWSTHAYKKSICRNLPGRFRESIEQHVNINADYSVKGVDLSNIFSENVAAKIVQVAQRGLKQPVRARTPKEQLKKTNNSQAPLGSYPHTVPQDGPEAGKYEEREADFWTCGFFPGCIYSILERAMRYPQAVDVPEHVRPQFQEQILRLGRHYGVAISKMSKRTDTHDMGFIVQPALQKDWELTGNKESLQSVINAAYALASRYDDRVKAIRSWDVAINNRYSITDMEIHFLVIIDSMCSMYPLLQATKSARNSRFTDVHVQ